MKVRTNKVWREFVGRAEVPSKILKGELDWCDDETGFFKYLGTWYHDSQFMRVQFDGWHGAHNDSAFSGVLIKLSSDSELFQVGRFSS